MRPRIVTSFSARSFGRLTGFLGLLAISFNLVPTSAANETAGIVAVDDLAMPGSMVIGEAPSGSEVRVDGRKIRLSETGRFVFGIGRDASGKIGVTVDLPTGSRVARTVRIDARDYRVQHIDGLPPAKVEPGAAAQSTIETDWVMINEAKKLDSAHEAFVDQAVWPVIGRISGVFGSQRILNGKPKSPHRGVDVAASTGTPVGAMMDGVVTVAAPDMYYTGGTVMVDHGHGVQSLYAHLSALDVKVGQKLTKGEQLGRIGATGRATGPHLHLSLYWFKTALDPALVLGPMPKSGTAGVNTQ